MNLDFPEFVHARHMDAFVKAAAKFDCHILVRRTGRASLQYVGKTGYTGKRADMKAKTAKRDAGGYQLAGLVCSPAIHPGAYPDLADAMKWWALSGHLVKPGDIGDNDQPRGWDRPYMVQTNPRHKHYGCVAWVENGLLTPRYVHGDYDLYAIFPAGRPPNFANVLGEAMPMPPNIMAPPASMTLEQRVRREALLQKKAVTDLVGPWTMQVTTFLNVEIARVEPGLLGALMVNHGEHINQGPHKHDFQPVLAFMPKPRGSEHAKVLHNRQEHEEYYRNA